MKRKFKLYLTVLHMVNGRWKGSPLTSLHTTRENAMKRFETEKRTRKNCCVRLEGVVEL